MAIYQKILTMNQNDQFPATAMPCLKALSIQSPTLTPQKHFAFLPTSFSPTCHCSHPALCSFKLSSTQSQKISLDISLSQSLKVIN